MASHRVTVSIKKTIVINLYFLKKKHKTKRDFNFNIDTNIAITTLGNLLQKRRRSKKKKKTETFNLLQNKENCTLLCLKVK
jgi:hypothetical protein